MRISYHVKSRLDKYVRQSIQEAREMGEFNLETDGTFGVDLINFSCHDFRYRFIWVNLEDGIKYVRGQRADGSYTK